MNEDAIGRALRALDRPTIPSREFASVLERRLLVALGRDGKASGRSDRTHPDDLFLSPSGRMAERGAVAPATKRNRPWTVVGQVATAAILVLTMLRGYVAFALLRQIANVSAPAAPPESAAALLARCPGTESSRIPGGQDFFTNGLGGSPIWIASWGRVPGTPTADGGVTWLPGATFQPGARYVAPYGWAHRAIVMIESGFTGLITLHGSSLDDGSLLWFAIVGEEPTAATTLDPQHPAIPLQHGDWTASPPVLWPEFPSGIYFPKTGCYELTAEWDGGSWRATIPYVAPEELPDDATPRP